MFKSIPHSVLQKNTCQHKTKKCNILNPYNNLELYGNTNLTEKEKSNNLKRFNTSCSNRQGNLTVCCDKNDPKLEDVLAKMKYKRPLGAVEYNKFGQLESIDFCLEEDPKKCDSKYKKLNAYEICKIPEDAKLNEGKLTNFKQDCYDAKCNPQEKTMNINGIIEEDYTYEFDKEVAQTIKHNKLKNLQKFLMQDKSLLKRPLTHSREGNTIYHEALKYNAKHILVYLFKNITQDIANKLNSEGNTILHMVMEQDNTNTLVLALKMGCDVNAKNNNNETPIFNAIRAGLYDNVRIILNYSANIYVKNKNQDTPLLFAVKTPKKDYRIVKLLIDNGADINDTGKDEISVYYTLDEKVKKTREEQEILTFLRKKIIQNDNVKLGKELNVEKTRELNGILYDIITPEGDTKEYDFKITIDYEDELKFPKDLHFPQDLKEDPMKPFSVGDKNYSHEPYYNKFKNLQKDKIKQLRQTIQLTKWDNNNNKDRKLKIIDEVMSGELSFDKYRKKVIIENNITKEQEFLLDNINEEDILDYNSPIYSPAPEKIILTTKSNKETPININTTKDIELSPKYSPAILEDEESFYDKYSTLIIICTVIITVILLFALYSVTKPKKLDFFN